MTRLSRLLVGTAALLLLALYVLPLWQVRLVAPQYPEGLGMYIHIDNVRGTTETDLGNINELNHYIGMQRIEASSIKELAIMPWVVGALIVTGLLVAGLGRARLLYAWCGTFVVLGIAGLVDFWRWEYNYGHHLDMDTAIIKIPGMSYQPPIIGSKQLLNFTAVSWPASGGIIAGAAFLLAVLAVVLTWRAQRGAGAAAIEIAPAASSASCVPSAV